MTDLPRCTWDQAAILNWWPARAFKEVGINPATVRQWAHRNHIRPVAIGPRGAKLYDYADVVRHADHQETP